MRLLDSDEARQTDRVTIDEIGLPALVLQESAALAVAEVLERRFPAARRVVLVCGAGNNGADGLALARQLRTRGIEVEPLLVARADELRAEAAIQRRALAAVGIAVEEIADAAGLAIARAALARADLVVDALFGVGLSRPISGFRAELVALVNAARAPRLAIDVPSGLAGGSGQPQGPHVAAEVTVTFFAPKRALVLPPAEAAAGEVWVAPLGVPPAALERLPTAMRLVDASEVGAARRRRESHKGTFGHLVVVAGSPGKSGAAVLAARGALRSGAGLVTVAAPAAIRAEVDAGCVEAMTLALPGEAEAPLGGRAAATLQAAIAGKSAIALGPGLGGDPATATWIRDLVRSIALPLALDADGCNAFAGRAEELRSRPAATVLTPHPAELGRLLGGATPRGSEERLEAVTAAAAATGAVVVLKGYRTLIAAPGGPVQVNPTGNPGMATAGSGDVLTGAVGAWLARGLPPLDAALTAVYLHGLAGDLVAATRGEEGMVASDLAEQLPEAARRVGLRRRRPRVGLAFAAGAAEVAELVAMAPPRRRRRG